MKINEALSQVNANASRAMSNWSGRIAKVNEARTAVGLEAIDSWTGNNLCTILETFKNRCDIVDGMRRQGMGGVLEATQPTDVSFLRTHGINILTATMPSLIANDLVSIQPLQARVGEIRYLQVKFGNSKGRVKEGDTMFSYDRVGGPNAEFGYTYDEVNGEVPIWNTGKTSCNLSWLPVQPGSIELKVGTDDYTDDGKGNLVNTSKETKGHVDYDTGTVTLTTAATSTDNTSVNYLYNNITAPTQAPEMDLSIKGIPVIARARKLKTVLSFDAMFDMQAQYGFDATNQQTTLASQYLQYEIDGEIVQDLYQKAAAKQTTFSSTVPNAVAKLDHYEGLIATWNEASNNIFEETRFASGTWGVLGLDAATIVESLANRGFQAAGTSGENGPHFIGTMGNYRLYKTPNLGNYAGVSERDGYVMGYKGETMFHAGYVYAPYMPIMTTDLLAQEDFGVRQGYATAYAKQIVNAKLYSKGKITK